MHGNVDPLKLLIRQDSNIGIPDIEGKTPLHWAASSPNPQAVDCVQLILVSSGLRLQLLRICFVCVIQKATEENFVLGNSDVC